MRGPRPPAAGWPRAEHNSPAAKSTKPPAAAKSEKGQGKEQSPGEKGSPFKAQDQPQPTEERKAQRLLDQDERLKAAQVRVAKAALVALGAGGSDQGSCPSPHPTCPRSGRTERSVSVSISQEIADNGRRRREDQGGCEEVGRQDPRR